jgi:hypothetical protein
MFETSLKGRKWVETRGRKIFWEAIIFSINETFLLKILLTESEIKIDIYLFKALL